MWQRMKLYFLFLDEQLKKQLSQEELEALRTDVLVQIGFFSHERLIHLIVTVAFAFMEMLSLIMTVNCVSPVFLLLAVIFFVMLIPYVLHYYRLENGVQKLYAYYDRIETLITDKDWNTAKADCHF